MHVHKHTIINNLYKVLVLSLFFFFLNIEKLEMATTLSDSVHLSYKTVVCHVFVTLL